MGNLLETNEPWESLEFLKLIHEWRENFDEHTSGALKDAVVLCFDQRRVQALVKLIVQGDQETRRSILQMFNSLHLEAATRELALMLGWEVPPGRRGRRAAVPSRNARDTISSFCSRCDFRNSTGKDRTVFENCFARTCLVPAQ